MCNETNRDIKRAAKNSGVFHWEIAEKLGIQDSAFSRKLRRELPDQEKQEILKIIETLAAERMEAS